MKPIPPQPRHRTPSPGWIPPEPPRPDSPTYVKLRGNVRKEALGVLAVPVHPSRTRRATVEEWGAVQTFKANMDKADPTGKMRTEGEFFQTFTSKPKELDYVANHPILYQKGNGISAPPENAFPPGTDQIVHSHPASRFSRDGNFPSGQDYLTTYLLNDGNAGKMGGIMYHAGEDRAYAFNGKLNPETKAPEFHHITQPSPRDNQEWLELHGHVQPPPAPKPEPMAESTSRGRPITRRATEPAVAAPIATGATGPDAAGRNTPSSNETSPHPTRRATESNAQRPKYDSDDDIFHMEL